MHISVVCNFLSSFFLTAQHSAPYTMASFIAVFYTLSFNYFVGMFPSHIAFTSVRTLKALLISCDLCVLDYLVLNIHVYFYHRRVWRVGLSQWSRGSSVIEGRTHNRESPGLNPTLATVSKFWHFRSHRCPTPVDSAV